MYEGNPGEINFGSGWREGFEVSGVNCISNVINNKSGLWKTVRLIRFWTFSKTTNAMHFRIFFKFAHQPSLPRRRFLGSWCFVRPHVTNLKNFKSLLLPILNFSHSDFCFLFFLIDDFRFEFLTCLFWFMYMINCWWHHRWPKYVHCCVTFKI